MLYKNNSNHEIERLGDNYSYLSGLYPQGRPERITFAIKTLQWKQQTPKCYHANQSFLLCLKNIKQNNPV